MPVFSTDFELRGADPPNGHFLIKKKLGLAILAGKRSYSPFYTSVENTGWGSGLIMDSHLPYLIPWDGYLGFFQSNLD
jgi:hypothetical protein